MGLLNFRRKNRKQPSDYPSTFIQSEVEIPSSPVYNENYLSLSSPTLSKSQTSSKVPETSLMDDIMNELGSSKDTSSKPMPSSTTNPKAIRPLLQFDTPSEETVKSATSNPAASSELESARGHQKPLLHFSSIKKPTFQHQENKKLELQQENHINNFNNRDEHAGDADKEEEKEDNDILGSRLMQNQVKRHSAPVNNKSSPAPLSSSSASDISNEPVQPSSKTLMDRMKERHRQEARRSSSSPFVNRNLSSPSMPIIAGATTDRFGHVADGSKNRPQKNMVQSQSCNTFMKPSVTVKNENRSFDIFNAPIQTQSDISLNNTRRFHSLQHSYHQSALSSIPIQENEEEDIPSLPRFALNRSVSAYPGFPTRSLQQQQQILLQQQIQQQQIQQQIELQQHQLEEQQRLQQQKLQQLHLQQKQQQEQNNINQAILDSIMSSSLEYEAGKHHLTSKPLYKRLPVEKHRKHHNHHHHHHHHQKHRHHHCSYHSNDSCKSIALHKCRTPPPESHHLTIDESKNKKEALERPISPVSLTDKEKLASIEDIIMNSSSSTLASDPKIKVVDIPLKLKRELQDMQLRRSPYSVPDLSTFLKENISEIDEDKWNTLCPISNSENKTKEEGEEEEGKIQEESFCRKRHRCRSKCCHHRQCYSSTEHCSNTLKYSQSTCSMVSEVNNMAHCHHKKPVCLSARHCKHH